MPISAELISKDARFWLLQTAKYFLENRPKSAEYAHAKANAFITCLTYNEYKELESQLLEPFNQKKKKPNIFILTTLSSEWEKLKKENLKLLIKGLSPETPLI